MLDDELTTPPLTDTTASPAEPVAEPAGEPAPAAKKATKRVAKKTTAKKAPAKRAAKKTVTEPTTETAPEPAPETVEPAGETQVAEEAAAKKTPAKKATTKKATTKKAATKKTTTKKAATKKTATKATFQAAATVDAPESAEQPDDAVAVPAAVPVLFQPPAEDKPTRTRKKAARPVAQPAAGADAADGAADAAETETGTEAGTEAGTEEAEQTVGAVEAVESDDDGASVQEAGDDSGEGTGEGTGEESGEGAGRRRRRRGGRRRRRGSGSAEGDADETAEEAAEKADAAENGEPAEGSESGSSRRRRRRRRAGEEGDTGSDDPANTVTRVRAARTAEDEIAGFTGSTRLEAKKQRRREGREAGRRRAPIISEAEFLARREAVERVMVIRQHQDLTQIAVMEDKVLVEHYVSRETQTSLIGNVYLGRVQNVLPSMEAAFIDIGKGRNAVLYAGEVNWDALSAKDGSQRKIESVLKSGQTVLVQVTKDPIGHKGARLTSQVSLPGRFLVYVPEGTTSGISRKLPDTERNRLKTLLKQIVPESAGVIVRTAAEGASEEELTRDVERLKARWEDIEKKVAVGNAPQLLYGEPDLTLKVVRDLFTEDFAKLVISGSEAWETVSQYVEHVAPDLADRMEKHDGDDAFASYRIHEQIAKGLDRKVWLPSGGSLIIDRTEAMTVVDVNTGKFTGSGGNLEETVTKNNLEAAEEVVRQLRLRDIGGIIVVDFIDMVLESNRDLVLRRLVECLGRDRTRHQVAEVTSLGLVQMTRKRIGTGLLEAFSHTCEQCQGRGVIVAQEPVEAKRKSEEEPRRTRRNRGKAKSADESAPAPTPPRPPSPADLAALPRHEQHEEPEEHGSVDEGSRYTPPSSAHSTNGGESAASGDESAASGGESAASGGESAASGGESGSVDGGSRYTPPSSAHSTNGGESPASGDEFSTNDDEPATDPSVVDVEPEPTAPVEPAAPTIVTSVRRIGARRAAGPPATTEPPRAGLVLDEEPFEPVDLAADDPDPIDEHVASGAAHVPIKRKGSRKR